MLRIRGTKHGLDADITWRPGELTGGPEVILDFFRASFDGGMDVGRPPGRWVDHPIYDGPAVYQTAEGFFEDGVEITGDREDMPVIESVPGRIY